MASQVELAVLDFYRHWDSFVALAPCRRRWLAEPVEQFVQSVFKRYICSLKRMAGRTVSSVRCPTKIVVEILSRNCCPRPILLFWT
jgi:hypothetical protein